MSVRFAPGDAVRVQTRDVATHCRTPYYLRGKCGVVTRVFGEFPNPEQLAYHEAGARLALYHVAFDAAEVWGKPQKGATIAADIYEHWLESPGSAS
jgi:hypothetical protein